MARPKSKPRGAHLGGIVSRQGLANTSYLRSGMRDLTTHRGAFAGASKREVARIAAGKVNTRNSAKAFAPVRVSVYNERGQRRVALEDGRHRMTAAREAGAKRINASVTEYGPRGGRLRSWTGLVRLEAAPRGKAGAGGGKG